MPIKKVYVVKTMRLNNYLVDNGFKMLRPSVDKYNKNFIVFLYEDTPKLREIMSMYKNNK